MLFFFWWLQLSKVLKNGQRLEQKCQTSKSNLDFKEFAGFDVFLNFPTPGFVSLGTKSGPAPFSASKYISLHIQFVFRNLLIMNITTCLFITQITYVVCKFPTSESYWRCRYVSTSSWLLPSLLQASPMQQLQFAVFYIQSNGLFGLCM